MRISYRYEPDCCRFWIGARQNNGDKEHHHEIALQSWMDVDEVIDMLRACEHKVDQAIYEDNSHTD